MRFTQDGRLVKAAAVVPEGATEDDCTIFAVDAQTDPSSVKSTLPAEPTVVRLVPPLAMGKVPVTPVVNGKPVALVRVADVGVPRMGVTSVGLVLRTLSPVPVVVVTPVPP
jgi:hypothetical protein